MKMVIEGETLVVSCPYALKFNMSVVLGFAIVTVLTL
jgi:hypothetical protein